MYQKPHPTALLIKELNFRGRNITFKATDLEDRNHMYYLYDERGVDNYNHEGLPYFICYDFLVYKNEFNFNTLESNETFIIKTKSTRKHKFPNIHKLKLHEFKTDINIFHYNKINPKYTGNTHDNIFNNYCELL